MDILSLKKIGPYVIERFIDAGAFAWVFEVVDPKFAGRRLAVKMLKPEAAEGEEFRRFQAEARLLAQIDHPNLVTIFDFGKDEATGNFYYVMTFVDGLTLKNRLKEGPMSLDEALPIFVCLLDGLSKLHESGIVHRDIKPGNVLLGTDGRPRLADLGIARVQAERGQTRTGVAVGTALYMSPEQARGRLVDARSDLFSLGLSLYETLTGQVIYDNIKSLDSSSGMDVLMYIGSLVHTNSEFDIRFDRDSKVPRDVQKIIQKSLRLTPDARFDSASEMRDALEASMRAPVVAAPSHHVPLRTLAAAGGAVGLVTLLLVAYFFYWSPRQQMAELGGQASQRAEETRSLGERATSLLQGVAALGPEAPAEIVAAARKEVERGRGHQKDGGEDLQNGSLMLAIRNFERGHAEYTAACQQLADGFLTARADADGTALRDRALRLSDQGAQEITAGSWPALAKVLPQTAAPGQAVAGCAAAAAQLARIQASAHGVPLADTVERELAEAWPRVANEAYDRALVAREKATISGVLAREFRLAVKDAKRQLLQGSRMLENGNHQGATEAYRAAERSFLTAIAIAPAAQGRAESHELAQQAAGEEVPGLEEITQIISRGDEAYAVEKWVESSQLYASALEELDRKRTANRWRVSAIASRKDATRSRAEAVAMGAEKSAPTEFAQAEISFNQGQQSLEAERAEPAEQAFRTSRDEFAAAKQRALRALEDVEGLRRAVEEARAQLPSSCDELGAAEAKERCAEGEEFLAAGNAAEQEFDAPQARRQYYAAQEAYVRASSAQRIWRVSRPSPPELVRRVPELAVVAIDSRQLQGFAVEVSDRNGDLLKYTWSIDGEVQEDRGPAIRRSLVRSAAVSVKVEDGNGGELIESWRVEVRGDGASPGS